MDSFTEICSLLVTCVLLPIVLCLPQPTEAIYDQQSADALKKFTAIEDWSLNSFGNSSAEFLKIFLTAPVYSTIQNTVNAALYHKNKFLKTAFSYTLLLQIPLTIAVVVGILVAFLLLFLPFFISFYRSKQRIYRDDRTHVPPKGWILFGMFIICSVIALVFAVILSISSIRAYYTILVPFKFATFCVESAFELRAILQRNFQNNLRMISYNAFDSSMALYNVNEEVGSSFMKRMKEDFVPILNFAGTMTYQLTHSAETLTHHRDHLNLLVNTVADATKAHADNFTSAVKELREVYKSARPELDLLLNLPGFNVSADAVKTLIKPIEALTEASKSDSLDGFHDVYSELQIIATDIHYDPSDLIGQLRHFIFKIEKKLRSPVEKYLAFVEASFMNGDQVSLIKQIRAAESETLDAYYIVYCLMLFFSILSLICIIITIVVYTTAICKTGCFQKDSYVNEKDEVQPNWAGRALLFFCYCISCFLWMFWVLNVFLFLFTSLPLQICLSVRDKSIFDATFDSQSFREAPHWYSMFTSSQFNMSLRNTIHYCRHDSSYVTFLPETVVSKRDSINLVSRLNFTAPTRSFESGIQNLTTFNTSSDSLPNLTNVLAGVDLHPPFQTLQDILLKVMQLNAPEVLHKIEKSTDVKTVLRSVQFALDAYEALQTELRSRIGVEVEFNISLKMIKASVQAIDKELADLVWVSSALYKSIVKNSPSIYGSILNRTVFDIVDAIFFEMRLGIVDLRKSLSFCRHLSIFYEKSIALFCNVVLYPVSATWFSASLLCIFLLLSIWLSISAVHLFFDPPKRIGDAPQVSNSDRIDSSSGGMSEENSSHGRKSSWSNRGRCADDLCSSEDEDQGPSFHSTEVVRSSENSDETNFSDDRKSTSELPN